MTFRLATSSADPPNASFTVRVSKWTPVGSVTWICAVVPSSVPSSSVHRKESASPSGSLPEPTRVTPEPNSPTTSGPALATGGRLMAKGASLTSDALPEAHEMRTSADAVLGPVTSQAKEPELGVASTRVAKVAPPSRLSSRRTDASAGRLLVQVMACAVPGAQVSGPLGAVRAREGATMARGASSAPMLPEPSRASTRRRAAGAAGREGVHGHWKTSPARSVQPGNGAKVVPPSAEKKTSKRFSMPLSSAFQLTVVAIPATRVTLRGAMTSTLGAFVSLTLTLTESVAAPPKPSRTVRVKA